MSIRGKTKEQAINSGMERETDLEQNTTHCPECGCPWFGNKNMCGEGHRVCFDCYQDYYTNSSYSNPAKLRELD